MNSRSIDRRQISGFLTPSFQGLFDHALKILEETSQSSDEILGTSHKDSIITLRCWMKVAWVSGDENKAKELHGKLAQREKPAAI